MTILIPELHDGRVRRRLGCVAPPVGFVSAVPEFRDHVETLDNRTLERIAKSNTAIGRTRFGSSMIADQGRWGSCNGWAGAKALERARLRRGLSHRVLSGTYLYSRINCGRDSGSNLDAGMSALQKWGTCPVSFLGTGDIYRGKYDTRKADRAASSNRAFECFACGDLAEVWTALALGWDVVVAVHAGSAFSRIDSNGFSGVNRGQGNHAVAADGLVWSGGGLAADAYNSWGTRWGTRGRMLLGAGHFRQTIRVHKFYAIRSAVDGDESLPPVLR